MLRSTEDNADDEFVFVANKTVAARASPSHTRSRTPGRPHPRLLQPIPTTLEVQQISPTVAKAWPHTATSTTTTARAKATPLPPELIELLPPHLRENTVPDYSISKTPPEDDQVPERPPLPTTYCPGDYCNLSDSPTPSSTHNYGYLSDLITSDALSVLTATHSHGHTTRAASLTSTRSTSTSRKNGTVDHPTSHTAPAALGITGDSGISSGGSSMSSSSNSSRSSSSRSLPREDSKKTISGRPLQPPSPKFARTPTTKQSSSVVAASTSPAQPLTRVSYTAVLASDGEKASMFRRLEALTPTPSPLLHNFRANTGGGTQLAPIPVEQHPHTRHVASAHTTLTLGHLGSTPTITATMPTPTTTHPYGTTAAITHTVTISPTTLNTTTTTLTATTKTTSSHTPTHTPTSSRKSKAVHHVSQSKEDGKKPGGGGGASAITASPLRTRRVIHTPPTYLNQQPTITSPRQPSPIGLDPHNSSITLTDHPTNVTSQNSSVYTDGHSFSRSCQSFSISPHHPSTSSYNPTSSSHNPNSIACNPSSTSYNPSSTSYNPSSAAYNPSSTSYNPTSTACNPSSTSYNSSSTSNSFPPSSFRDIHSSPPSSPELRRAWNVLGVPTRAASEGPTVRASPTPSPKARTHQVFLSQNDPDCIYDNLVAVRHPPLASPMPKPSPPMASVTPQPHSHSSPPALLPPRRCPQSPLVMGKPPSPPTQRRSSRSPTPTRGWSPASGQPVSPHYIPYYPSQDPNYSGCWVPVWGSSPQLYQGGTGPPVYQAYVYSGPLPPGGSVGGGGSTMCNGRSHSCDRLPSRPSPPPSPRCGRRSASPWRSGSVSPVGHRHHSPSPDPGSGRPPRPRRPPAMRKSKTVEVGCLGLGSQPSSTGGKTSNIPNDPRHLPIHPITYLEAPPNSRLPTGTYFLPPLDPSHPNYHKYTHAPQHLPNIGVIHEQLQKCNGFSPEESAASVVDNSPVSSSYHNSTSVPSITPSHLPSTSVLDCKPLHQQQQQQQQQAGEVTKPKGSSLEDRVNRLEGDKDSLQLQVTVLSEQVEAQTEKISDLENLLEEKKELLRKTEEHLQKEVMTRSSLETQRLELFSEISNLKLRQAAFERENLDLREKLRRSDQQSEHIKSQLANQLANSPSPSSISTLSTIPASSPNKSPAQPITASPTSSPVAPHEAREYLPPRTPPPNARRKIEQFGTMPRQRDAGETNQGATTTGRNKGVMFGKGLHFLPFRVAGKRSTSAPNLAETEMQMIDDVPEGEYGSPGDGIVPTAPSSPRGNALSSHRSPPTHHKTTGIKKIFTRLRRSSSGHLDSDLGDGDFRRGGMRATAAARLGWTSPTSIFKEPSEAFSGWNIDVMEAWLGLLGLSQYSAAVRSWSGAGHHLSRATPQHLERDLGIRHPLHRKKLQLALAARTSGEQVNTPLGRLDHSWVLRWLDDVGLPQYKDAFSEARIDGRVLNCLTYDDLAFLRLTNLLHVTSLKRGIQVLREYNFDPSVLKRRSVPEEGQRVRSAAEVALWTNHRVMEWLRTVDLSEYAPNLRGSGVHGALMVYEVRFTSELLASLLSIPCGKTLLRRHLNTHFKELVGLPVVQEKRELEAAPGYTALTTSAKVKMPKKSQFSLKRKKSKTELEFDDLLCPLDEKPPLGAIQDKEKERLHRASAPPLIGRITKV